VSAPAAPAPVITTGGGSPAHVPEAPVVDTPAVETPDKFEFSFDGDTEKYEFKEDTPAEESPSYDASKPFDAKWEELLKADPEALKAVKQGHYELRQWKGSGFKTPAELKAYRDRIDKLGGPEKMEAESKEWSTVLNQFRQGDEAVLDSWFKDNPDGMAKLSGPMLDRLQKQAPQVWAHHMATTFMATLLRPNAQGLSSLAAFNQLYDIVGENSGARKLLDQIAETINAVDKAAKSSPEAKSKSVDSDRKQLDVERHTLYLQKVNVSAEPLINSAAKQALKVALKGRKVSSEVEADLLADIKKGFNELQKADGTFQENARDLLRSQDTDRFLRVLKSAIARNLPRAALREVRKYRGISGDNQQRKAEGQARQESAGGAATQGQRVRYSGAMKQGGPDPAIIDYAGMRAQFGRKGTEEMLGRREFFKKGGGSTVFFW
jgi:hypothetical protein